MKPKRLTWIRKLRGWWRALHGFCPECNNSGPALDKCRVCGGYHSATPGCVYPHPKELQAEWWKRFTGELPLLPPRCTHNIPMDKFCYECFEWRTKQGPAINPRKA